MISQFEEKSILQNSLMNITEEWLESKLEEQNSSQSVDNKIKDNLFQEPSEMIFQINNSLLLDEIQKDRIALNDDIVRYETCDLVESISKDVFSFGPISLEEAIPMLEELKSDEMFYGVIATNGTDKINLYHPMVASYISENWETYKDKEYTYYVYSGSWKKEYESNEQDIEYVTSKIEKILALRFDKSNIQKEVTYFSDETELNRDSLQDILYKNIQHILFGREPRLVKKEIYKDKDGNTIDSMKMNYLIPNQILNIGVAFPYYGISTCYINDTLTRGVQIAPMLTPNLSESYNISSSDHIIESRVCTGSLNNRTVRGLRTLNHANLKSPYFKDVLCYGWETWVEVSLQISSDIYNEVICSLEPTTNDVNVNDNLTARERFFIENDTSSNDDWLNYLYTRNQQMIETEGENHED